MGFLFFSNVTLEIHRHLEGKCIFIYCTESYFIIIIYLLPAIGWSPGGRSQLHFVHVIQFHGLPTVPLFTSGWGYM